ncbi:MAG: HlyD family efflux transporter periplasmic adaptor subunit [Hominilimicola sp.]
MKKFFIIVLCIAVAAIAGYGIKYVMTPVNTQKIEYITQENSINTNGFIIRDEWVMYSRSAGTVYHSVSEGARVAKDSIIGSLFYGNVPEDSIKELAVVDNKIKNAETDKSEQSFFALDEATVENNIYERENNIIDAAEDNDIVSISKYKRDINSLRQNNELSADDSVTEFKNQREQILNSIGVAQEDITAQISGVFTTYVDGYETMLVPSDIEGYDVAYFESLSQSPHIRKISAKVDAGGEVCKIVNNHMWYVMMDIPADVMKERGKGDSVKLRFNNMADAVVKGTISSVSEEQNGRVIVTVKCSTYLESAFSYRLVDVDLIFESYDGYKIPIHAIRTEEDGKQKVIGINGGKQYDCYCDVLFTNTDGGYAIVDSTDNAQNKLSQMDRILVGER